jgi:hypothetical protein
MRRKPVADDEAGRCSTVQHLLILLASLTGSASQVSLANHVPDQGRLGK